MKNKVLVSLLFLLLFSALAVIPVGAMPDESKWTTAPPTIDGILDVGEWDAYFWFTDNTGINFKGTPVFTGYVANDDQFLYVAIDVEDATPLEHANDDIWIAFRDAGDNYKEFRKGNTTWGMPVPCYSEEPYTPSYQSFPADCEFKWTTSTGHIYYELKIPLARLNVDPGDTTKYLMHVRDFPAKDLNYHPDVTSWSPYDERNQFGDLTLSQPPKPPVGGIWVPINKTELLAPWIGLASLITVAAVSVVYVRRRKKQQS